MDSAAALERNLYEDLNPELHVADRRPAKSLDLFTMNIDAYAFPYKFRDGTGGVNIMGLSETLEEQADIARAARGRDKDAAIAAVKAAREQRKLAPPSGVANVGTMVEYANLRVNCCYRLFAQDPAYVAYLLHAVEHEKIQGTLRFQGKKRMHVAGCDGAAPGGAGCADRGGSDVTSGRGGESRGKRARDAATGAAGGTARDTGASNSNSGRDGASTPAGSREGEAVSEDALRRAFAPMYKCVQGSNEYWKKFRAKCFAMINTCGNPHFFFTFAMNEMDWVDHYIECTKAEMMEAEPTLTSEELYERIQAEIDDAVAEAEDELAELLGRDPDIYVRERLLTKHQARIKRKSRENLVAGIRNFIRHQHEMLKKISEEEIFGGPLADWSSGSYGCC